MAEIRFNIPDGSSLVKQYVSKTIFSLSKDGITDTFELTQGVVFSSISKYMMQFEKNWEMLCEMSKLTKDAQEG